MRKFRFNEAKKTVEQSDDNGATWKKIAENYTKERFHQLWESGSGEIREDAPIWVTVPGWREKLAAKREAQRLQESNHHVAARSFTMPTEAEQVKTAMQAFGMTETVAKIFVAAKSANNQTGYDTGVAVILESLKGAKR